MNGTAYVQLTGISKTYPGRSRPAVETVSFTLHAGEIMALLGPNGAGKTTIVKMIAGLVLPSAGTVCVLGHDMVRARGSGVRHIGAVLEGARNLYWRLSARENLLYFGSLRLVPRQTLNRRVDELLALLGLGEFQNQEVRQFSRGMQQKLAIAAALLHDPEVLLLDEPTLGLDVQAARKLEDTIAHLAREQGKAVLLTTHTMPLAEKLADRVFVIHNGREVAQGTPHELGQRFNGQRDAVEVGLGEQLDEATLAAVRERYPGVTAVSDGDATTLVWSAPVQSDVIALLQWLDHGGVTVLTVNRRQARLEDVFLSLTDAAAQETQP
jgi:ABC-2 type transport system ATP-binding protein